MEMNEETLKLEQGFYLVKREVSDSRDLLKCIAFVSSTVPTTENSDD